MIPASLRTVLALVEATLALPKDFMSDGNKSVGRVLSSVIFLKLLFAS